MNLKDALELAGVDYEMTLNRFSNNAMLLERFVKKFPTRLLRNWMPLLVTSVMAMLNGPRIR